MFGTIQSYFRLRYGRDKAYYRMLKTIFGLRPNNIELYKLALIHRSASLFLDDGAPINNERLEFLGDAVIESIVSDFLFIEFPEADEGFLSRLRSRIVRRSSLNRLAIEIGLDRYVIAQGGNGFAQKHLYGDTLEAMMGAVYLDKGYDFSNRLFINGILRKYVDLDDMSEQETDFKSRLIEWSQKNKMEVSFELIEQFLDRDYNPMFHTEVRIESLSAGTGTGYSKKESQQNAAQMALKKIKNDEAFKEAGMNSWIPFCSPSQNTWIPAGKFIWIWINGR